MLFKVMYGNLRQVYVVFRGFKIPAKHRIYGFSELSATCFANATGIYPEVSQTVDCSLLSAALYFLPPSLSLILCLLESLCKSPPHSPLPLCVILWYSKEFRSHGTPPDGDPLALHL